MDRYIQPCGLDDCCRPADWAPACTGTDVWAITRAGNNDATGACTACIGNHSNHRNDPAFCLPLPSRTACSAADMALDLNNDADLALMSGACLACVIALDNSQAHYGGSHAAGFWAPCTGGLPVESPPHTPPPPCTTSPEFTAHSQVRMRIARAAVVAHRRRQAKFS
jgi:hypothetical protein